MNRREAGAQANQNVPVHAVAERFGKGPDLDQRGAAKEAGLLKNVVRQVNEAP